MDGNYWRGGGQVPMVQPQAGTVEQLALSNFGGAPPVDPDEWRAHLPLDSRQRIVNKITEGLIKHLPFSGQEGLQELKRIAVRFEEKIYSAATNQSDYLRKISLKMLTMETRSQTPRANSLQPGAANASRNPSDLASRSMQSQIHNPGLAMPIVGGQPQGRQQLISQNMQNNVSAAGMQSSGSFASTLPAVSNLTQGSIANAVGSNSNFQNMENNSNVAQNSVMGQGMQSNVFANSQRKTDFYHPIGGMDGLGGGQVPMVQPQAGTVEQLALSNSGGAPPVDPDEWRAHLPLYSRQKIVDKITETLKKRLPFSGQVGLEALKKIAVSFEERIYSAATSQSDYLRKISLKMLTMETKSQSPMANSLQPVAAE